MRPLRPREFLADRGEVHPRRALVQRLRHQRLIEKLGGQPFDNTRRLYFGTSNDFLLNLFVTRLHADPAALAEMRARYDTTGRLSRPLVTLHTSRDQQVPVWHQDLYTLKAIARSSASQLIPIRVDRYGHCNFTAAEVLVSFALMVFKAEGFFDLARMERAVALPATREELRRLARERGLPRTKAAPVEGVPEAR